MGSSQALTTLRPSWKEFTAHSNSHLGLEDWTGVAEAGDDLSRLKKTWSIGRNLLESMPGVVSLPKTRARVWDWNQGDEFSVTRLQDGLAPYRRRTRLVVRGVDLRVNLAESGSVGSQELIYKAYAAARLVQDLERLGIPTAVSVEISATASLGIPKLKSGCPVHIVCTIKADGDNLDLGLLATATAPWSLRCFGIGYLAHCFGATGGEYFPKSLPESNEAAILIDSGMCLSQESANMFVSSALKLAIGGQSDSEAYDE